MGITRVSQEDQYLNGYFIKKDAIVQVNLLGIHTNPEYYENPLKFDPDRWLNPDLNPLAFLPFGLGIHQCVGMKMSIIETKVVLISLLQGIKFLECEDQVINKTTRLTYSIPGFKAIVQARA
jgi:cytochrome P450